MDWTESSRRKPAKNWRQARDRILQNRKMVELDCDLPLPVPIDDLRISPDYPRLIEAMERFEFKSLLEDVRERSCPRRPRRCRANCLTRSERSRTHEGLTRCTTELQVKSIEIF